MPRTISKKANISLWVVQALLAALFLFAGGMKLVMPIEKFTGPIALPGLFIRFVGVCEVAGALGLILPGLLRIRVELTSAAAAGLVGIMTGATVLTAIAMGVAPSIFPFVVGLLALTVLFGRRQAARSYQS